MNADVYFIYRALIPSSEERHTLQSSPIYHASLDSMSRRGCRGVSGTMIEGRGGGVMRSGGR